MAGDQRDYVVPDAEKATAMDYLTRAAWHIARAADECRNAADNPNTTDERKADLIGCAVALAHHRATTDIDTARRLVMFHRFGKKAALVAAAGEGSSRAE